MTREDASVRILFALDVAGAFTTALLLPTLPLYLMSRGLSIVSVGALYALVAVASIAAQAWAGRHAHRFARPSLALGLSIASAAVAPLYLHVGTPVGLVAVMAVGAVARAVGQPALAVLVAASAPAKLRARAYARRGLVWSMTYAAGLVVGGLLYAMGFRYVVGAAAILGLAAAAATALLLALRPRLPRPRTRELARAVDALTRHRDALRGHVSSLFRHLPASRASRMNVRLAGAHLFALNLALAAYPVYLPFHLQARGLPLAWIGAAVALSWVAYGLAQPLGAFLGRRTPRWRAIVGVCLVASAALNLAIAAAPLAWAIAAWALLGVADGASRPLTQAVIAGSVPVMERGRAFGWTGASAAAARIVAPFALALVAATAGLPVAIAMMSVAYLVALLPLLRLDVELRPLTDVAPRPQGGAA